MNHVNRITMREGVYMFNCVIDGEFYTTARICETAGLSRQTALARCRAAYDGLLPVEEILAPLGPGKPRMLKGERVRARAENLSEVERLAYCKAWGQ